MFWCSPNHPTEVFILHKMSHKIQVLRLRTVKPNSCHDHHDNFFCFFSFLDFCLYIRQEQSIIHTDCYSNCGIVIAHHFLYQIPALTGGIPVILTHSWKKFFTQFSHFLDAKRYWLIIKEQFDYIVSIHAFMEKIGYEHLTDPQHASPSLIRLVVSRFEQRFYLLTIGELHVSAGVIGGVVFFVEVRTEILCRLMNHL